MTFARAVLILGALVFAGIGLGFLIRPSQWAAVVDISLPTPTARTDLRATYGGFDLAIGIFLALCAARTEWLRPGLVALALCGAGFGGGRLLGMLVERTASRLMLTFFAIELSSVLLSLYALRLLSRSQP
jgi:hypothetical protein